MEREVYGRLPANIPEVKWTVAVTDNEFVGWTPVIAKKLIGHVDNSSYPLIQHIDGCRDPGKRKGARTGADDVWP